MMSDAVEQVAPQNLRAEASVIGACLTSEKAMAMCVDILDYSHFYRPAHGLIWRAMVALHKRGEAVDTVMTAAELERATWTAQSGGFDYLCECVDVTPSSANARDYARLVHGAWVRRQMLAIGERLKAGAMDPEQETDDVIATTTQEALALQMSSEDEDGLTHVEETLRQLGEMLQNGPTRRNRTKTGMATLDGRMGGLQKSDLIYLGGGPGSGKTTFAMQCAYNMASAGHPVVFVSMELGSGQFARRLASFGSKVEGSVLEFGPRDAFEARYPAVKDALYRISRLPIWVSFRRLSTSQIMTRVKQLMSREGKRPACVFIDRIEMLADYDCASMEETKRIPILSPRVKGIATALDVPVMCLVQLNRQGREGAPSMESFRASGSIEQDCQVGLILRSFKETERATLTIVKHNDGATGDCDEMVWAYRYPMFLEKEMSR